MHMQNLITFNLFLSQDIKGKQYLNNTKSLNFVVNLQKLMCNYPNLDVVEVMRMIKFHLFIHKVLSGNMILTITKGHNSIVNLQNG